MIGNDLFQDAVLAYVYTQLKTQKRMSAITVSNQTNTQTDSFYDMSTVCYCCTDTFTSTLEI